MPDATAIIFHGSRVRGLPTPTSDYDVLVLTPKGIDPKERKRIKKTLDKTFPSLTLDPAFGSERWMRANLNREAHLRFWLENGIAVYGRIPRIGNYPPLYKMSPRPNWIGSKHILFWCVAGGEHRRIEHSSICVS